MTSAEKQVVLRGAAWSQLGQARPVERTRKLRFINAVVVGVVAAGFMVTLVRASVERYRKIDTGLR